MIRSEVEDKSAEVVRLQTELENFSENKSRGLLSKMRAQWESNDAESTSYTHLFNEYYFIRFIYFVYFIIY